MNIRWKGTLEELPGLSDYRIKLLNEGKILPNGKKILKISDLNKDDLVFLPAITNLYLKYMEGLLFSYDEATRIVNFLKKFFNFMIVTGSYRREKKFLHDIDIIIKEEDIPKFYTLDNKNFKVYPLGKFNHRSLVFVHNKAIDKYYPCDIYIYKEKFSLSALILHTTGSKEFNIKMRIKAKKKNLKLNQYGIFDQGVEIICESEKDYFDILGMKYLEPKFRT